MKFEWTPYWQGVCGSSYAPVELMCHSVMIICSPIICSPFCALLCLYSRDGLLLEYLVSLDYMPHKHKDMAMLKWLSPLLDKASILLWRSLLVCACIKPIVSPVMFGIQPPNFTQVSWQPYSTYLWLKPHHPINEVAIVPVLSWQLLIQTGRRLHCQKWVPYKVRGLFSHPVCA